MLEAEPSTVRKSARAPRLNELPERAQQALKSIAVVRRWRSGQTLHWGGEVAASAFVVLKGRMRARTFGPNGDEQIVGWLEPGTFAGLSSVLAGALLPFDVIADGPCETMHLSRSRLLALLERDAPTSLALAQVLSARLGQFMEMHMLQAFAPLADRVWATLQRLSRSQVPAADRDTPFIEITQADLAHAVGASRYRVGLELKRFEKDGRVKLERRRIFVLGRQ